MGEDSRNDVYFSRQQKSPCPDFFLPCPIFSSSFPNSLFRGFFLKYNNKKKVER